MVRIIKNALALTLALVLIAAGVPAMAEEPTVLRYWTWFPNEEQLTPVIEAFEKENPDIKIELTMMESSAYQEKLPIALATNEDIDVVGVQPNQMVDQIKSYLAEIDPLLSEGWKEKLSPADIETCRMLASDNNLYMAPLFSCGAMIGFYNAALLRELNLEVPKTLEEYKAFAEAIRAYDPNMLPAVFGGKEAWLIDEMMLTVLGQSSDYFNKFRYEGASIDSEEMIRAMKEFKSYFDEGIFSMDIMDLDYGRSYEMFSTGQAATFFQGTWECGLLSESIRAANGIALTDVGLMALPVVKEGYTPTLRAFLDCSIGIVKNSQKKEAAARWIEYMTYGEGVDIWAKFFCGVPSKIGFQLPDDILGTEAERQGYALMNELVANATADRNNVVTYMEVEGAAEQRVIMGYSNAEDEVKALQQEWQSGKHGK